MGPEPLAVLGPMDVADGRTETLLVPATGVVVAGGAALTTIEPTCCEPWPESALDRLGDIRLRSNGGEELTLGTLESESGLARGAVLLPDSASVGGVVGPPGANVDGEAQPASPVFDVGMSTSESTSSQVRIMYFSLGGLILTGADSWDWP